MNDMKRKRKSEGKNKSHDGLSQPIYKTVCSTSSIIHIIKTEPTKSGKPYKSIP